MHEIAISETICKTIEKEAKNMGMEKVKTAKLRIGVMNAFDESNLELCLKGYQDNPLIADIKFDIEAIPVTIECNECHHEYKDERFDDFDFAHKTAHAPGLYLPSPCPKCKAETGKMIGGNEMELVSIDG